ncbi:F-box/kelch-repeat protein At5g26960 [Vigna radiata var. radiata]|uniref:F-box/kelch-repeat protein At5g26960 n=1 Tax=Vigna radiata var. radiata TaxID=3916 RepID=A0A1S3VHM0_VIGRR|nr:F-box/kelch-repeat protein At5g26960 [Vigna radiata var. radiata]
MSSERERESCNSRHFTWLMKSCFASPNDAVAELPSPPQPHTNTPAPVTTLSSLPDDIVLDCLSRVPPASLPALSLVCRRWSRLLRSPAFSYLRRRLHLLRHTTVALAATDLGLSVATLLDAAWLPSLFVHCFDAISLLDFHFLVTHARACSIGPRIYLVGRSATLQYDTWTASISMGAATVFPRKKFALSSAAGKIYVAGGSSRTAAVEEYDPETDTWVVVSNAPRMRYGCIGASVDGIFYVIGGLRIGASAQNLLPRSSCRTEAHAAYASSMDLFDVEARVWLRSRTVPNVGCVVAACAAAGRLYVLTSHAVEFSFWSFHLRRKRASGKGFGEWCRIKSPPLPAQVRVDTRMRFNFVGIGDKVVLIQSLNEVRGVKEGFVLVYDCATGEWERGADLPDVYRRATYVGVEC